MAIKSNQISTEKKVVLEYSNDEYGISFQLGKTVNINESFISVTVSKDDAIVDYIYVTEMKYEDFKKMDSKLLRLYDTTEQIFSFISESIDKNKISIKEITFSDFILVITTSESFGLDETLLLELTLKRKNCKIYDTVRLVCDHINKTNTRKFIGWENENKKLIEMIRKIENENKLAIQSLKEENKWMKFILNHKIFENEDELNFIKERLLQTSIFKGKNITLKLKYRSSRNGTSITNFNRICNNIHNNLTLIKTTENERFGGFTKENWRSRGLNIQDNDAFCFSLSKKKFFENTSGIYIYDYSGYGPYFDGYFYIGGNGNDLKYGSAISNNNSGNNRSYVVNNGKSNFTVQEFEIFEIVVE